MLNYNQIPPTLVLFLGKTQQNIDKRTTQHGPEPAVPLHPEVKGHSFQDINIKDGDSKRSHLC